MDIESFIAIGSFIGVLWLFPLVGYILWYVLQSKMGKVKAFLVTIPALFVVPATLTFLASIYFMRPDQMEIYRERMEREREQQLRVEEVQEANE